MSTLRHCSCCDKELPIDSFTNEEGDCKECNMKRFLLEVFESPKSEEYMWEFRNWEVVAYDTKSLLQESSQYLHIKVLQKDLGINLAVAKRTSVDGSLDDEFLVWVGDRQFVVKATSEPEPRTCGVVISSHNEMENL